MIYQLALSFITINTASAAVNYFCELQKTTPSGDETIYGHAFDNHCYFPVNEAASYRDMHNKCDDMGKGYSLVTVNSVEENSFLHQQFRQIGPFWIGLDDMKTEGTYEWTHGSSDYFKYAHAFLFLYTYTHTNKSVV
jgi:hypothetical protein